jgi:hypothetical protein
VSLTQVSYKQRNFYLLGGIFLFFIVSYFTAIQKTIIVYQKNNDIIRHIEQGKHTAGTLDVSEKRMKDLNNCLQIYSLDSLKNQQFVMSEVSNLCRNFEVTLKNFPAAIISDENDFSIETNIIETEGNFSNQLRLLHALETKVKIGRISSVTYKSYVDNKRKKTVLSLIIYLQNIKYNANATQI